MAREACGALWLKESGGADKKKYFSGVVTVDGKEARIVIFKNDYKKPGEKSPDYRIYPQEDRQAPPPTEAPGAPAADDDVPF
jgi:hypothetical protein